MAVPVISNLPPAPNRSDAPADFTPKADAMIGALQPFVVQFNAALTWNAAQLAAAEAAKNAAAASATAAANSAEIALSVDTDVSEQIAQAETAANNAAASAAAAEGSAGAIGNLALLHAVAFSF